MTEEQIVDLETRGGRRRRLDLTTVQPLDLSQRDWSTGVDIVDLLLPVRGGIPVVHTYSRWDDHHGGVLGDRYFEPDDATLAELRERFDEPALVAPGARGETR